VIIREATGGGETQDPRKPVGGEFPNRLGVKTGMKKLDSGRALVPGTKD